MHKCVNCDETCDCAAAGSLTCSYCSVCNAHVDILLDDVEEDYLDDDYYDPEDDEPVDDEPDEADSEDDGSEENKF